MHGEDNDIKPNIKTLPAYDGPFGMSISDFDTSTASGNEDADLNKVSIRHLQLDPAPKDSARKYTLYQSPEEIIYTPEGALKEGLGMVGVFVPCCIFPCVALTQISGPRHQRAR